VFLFTIVLNFFRNPSCIFTTSEEGIVVAPADGTIVVIEDAEENEYFRDQRMQISIFMSLFDAHVNWYPISGKITHTSYQTGRFMAAYLPKSSEENERSSVVIQTANGTEILVRQIAGAMAKRIVTYGKKDQLCRINEQMGFIKFGSRVDIFLPLDTEILVGIDQKVKGNQTPIARMKNA